MSENQDLADLLSQLQLGHLVRWEGLVCFGDIHNKSFNQTESVKGLLTIYSGILKGNYVRDYAINAFDKNFRKIFCGVLCNRLLEDESKRNFVLISRPPFEFPPYTSYIPEQIRFYSIEQDSSVLAII